MLVFEQVKTKLNLKKIIYLMLWLLILLIGSSKSIFAQEEKENFIISLHSTYTVTATGKTLVEQKFTIKNKTPELFVSKYGIAVSSTNLDNINVSHNGKKLDPEIDKQKGQTKINVTFTDKVIGEGKINELLISYTDQDLALISGKILEINIPELAQHDQYQNYQLELRVPSIFNTPSRINPSNFSLKQEGDYNIISYHDLKNQSVSAIFGNEQVFDLKLNYYLNNPTSQSALTQITLPPETPYQKVHYLNLDPLPKNIKEDADGNFIATYEIPANNSVNVELLTQVLLTLSADENVPFGPVLSEHFQEQKFWEVNHPTLIELAQNLATPRAIADFVVAKLDYTKKTLDQNFERLGALSAIKTENQNQATCQEFTDLFVALARQKQIPARRVVGIAYSNNEELRPSNVNSDILHTWPEYYDQEKMIWARIDPTWQDTTGGVDYFNHFDLNHISLAINGLSSTLPHPAGTYSGASDEKNKKIYLELAKTQFQSAPPSLSLDLLSKKLYGLSIPGHYEVQLLNQTGLVWYFKEIKITGEEVEAEFDQSAIVQKILPFAKISLPISVYNKHNQLRSNQTIKLKVTLQTGQTIEQEFNVNSSLQFKVSDPQKIIGLGTNFALFASLTGGLFFLGRRLANSLRRQGQKLEEKDHQLQALSVALKENQKNDGARAKSRISRPRK